MWLESNWRKTMLFSWNPNVRCVTCCLCHQRHQRAGLWDTSTPEAFRLGKSLIWFNIFWMKGHSVTASRDRIRLSCTLSLMRKHLRKCQNASTAQSLDGCITYRFPTHDTPPKATGWSVAWGPYIIQAAPDIYSSCLHIQARPHLQRCWSPCPPTPSGLRRQTEQGL